MGIMKDITDKYVIMLDLLSNVIIEMENNGKIETDTYSKIKEFFEKEDLILEAMHKR